MTRHFIFSFSNDIKYFDEEINIYLWKVKNAYVMSDIEKVRLFDNQKIRTVWVEEEEEWYFSVKDVVTILTETTNAKDYISKMRRRDEELSKGWGQIVPPYNLYSGILKCFC